MAPYLNIAQRILRAADQQGDAVAITIPKRQRSFAQLRQLILAYAQHARNHGIGRDSVVAIDIDNIVMKAGTTLACALLGAPWVEATPPVTRHKKLAYTHLLFGPEKNYPPSPAHLRIDAAWSVSPRGASLAFDGAGGQDDIWTYSQSSGTTGTPKFMAVSHRQNEEGFERGFNVREGERPIAAWLSASGAGRMTPMLRVLAQGGGIVGGIDLDLFMRAGVNRVSGSPAQYAKLLEGAPKPTRKIYVGQITGAAAAESLLVRMLDFFERVIVRYGSTEIGIVAERVIDSLPVDPSNVGPIAPTAEVELVDDDDRLVPMGEEGIVRIRRSDRGVTSYIGAEDITRNVFRGGWFYPGDLGRFSKNGDLHIVGRRDDRLNLGGVKIDAGRLDALIQNTPGVRDGYCFEDRDAAGVIYLALLLSLSKGASPDEVVQELYGAMNASGLHYRAHRAYVSDEIPRTETGKPVRRLAAEFVRRQKPFTISLTVRSP